MSFGAKLRASRLRCGLTQQQIADKLGITKSTYCGYETGRRQPDVQRIKELAAILGVTGDELLETGYGKTPAENDERQISDDDIKFALFGTSEVDDEVFEDVKALARVAAEQAAKRKRKKQE